MTAIVGCAMKAVNPLHAIYIENIYKDTYIYNRAIKLYGAICSYIHTLVYIY